MNYPLRSILLGLLLLGGAKLLGMLVSESLYHPHFPWLVLLFVASSIGIHRAIAQSAGGSAGRFPAYFMGITGLKMLAYLVGIGIYVAVRKEQAVPVVVAFLACYVLYTALEVASLLPLVRGKEQDGMPPQ